MATSTVYLIRSMGTIYGVTVTSAIVQNVLMSRLAEALGSEASDELVDKLRKSLFALRELPVETQLAVRALYGDALRLAFVASSSFALLAFFVFVGAQDGVARSEVVVGGRRRRVLGPGSLEWTTGGWRGGAGSRMLASGSSSKDLSDDGSSNPARLGDERAGSDAKTDEKRGRRGGGEEGRGEKGRGGGCSGAEEALNVCCSGFHHLEAAVRRSPVGSPMTCALSLALSHQAATLSPALQRDSRTLTLPTMASIQGPGKTGCRINKKRRGGIAC